MAGMVRILKRIALVLVAVMALYIANTYRNIVGVFTHNDTKIRQSTDWIIIHHDAVNRESDLYEIQANHLKEWHDYFPYTIYCKGGKIYQTRPLDVQTSHAIGRNSNGIAVCIHTADKENLLDQFNMVFAVWCLQLYYHIPRDRVVGHGEIENNNTACPEMDMRKFRSYLIP